jgi:hypothetical protein
MALPAAFHRQSLDAAPVVLVRVLHPLRGGGTHGGWRLKKDCQQPGVAQLAAGDDTSAVSFNGGLQRLRSCLPTVWIALHPCERAEYNATSASKAGVFPTAASPWPRVARKHAPQSPCATPCQRKRSRLGPPLGADGEGGFRG